MNEAYIIYYSFDFNLGSKHASKYGDKAWNMFVLRLKSAHNHVTSPRIDGTDESHKNLNQSVESYYQVIYRRL